LNEDTKAKVKDIEKKLREHLDDSNFILQGEDGVYLKMLEDLDNEGIGAMVEDEITPTKEEYDDMIVEECPEADDEEAVDKYLNMELRMGARTDDERWGQVIKHAKGIGGEPVGHAHTNPFFDTDKICMMTTRLACNRAIESSYWRMDNNSDVGLLTGYVLY
jgi:hypothetical protein